MPEGWMRQKEAPLERGFFDIGIAAEDYFVVACRAGAFFT